MPRVLLISPPWQEPRDSCLALATLRPLLEQAGIATDTLHGSTLYPLTPAPPEFMNFFSAFLFAAHLYPKRDRAALVDTMVREYVDYNNASGILYPQETVTCARLGGNEIGLRAGIWADIERAGIAIERCVERALAGCYDVIGLSCTFETQIPAALAIARRLRARRPEVRIALGGAACFEEQGDGLAASFPELDAVCHTEGEAVIVPLVRALRGELPLSAVPGIAYLDEGGTLRHNPAPPLLMNMDQLPIPDYGDFISQYRQSPWAARGEAPVLYFETSRGCWWGQKHLCTFCGLNAQGVTYRRKSPARALAEIGLLYRRYPEAELLQATDNILDMSYIEELMPRLAAMEQDPGRPLRIFYEVKSNLRRDQIQRLADGGVTGVQPGIEAFSDGTLALMDKGTTALMQARFIKWAYEAGISLYYNIIVRNPGDRASWYRQATRLVSFLDHLPPPVGVVAMMLERFSPYFTDPGRHGIERIRPREYYRQLYPDPRVDLDRIAYIFDYDHPILHDAELTDAQREFVQALIRWRKGWKPGRAFYIDNGEAILVVDRRGTQERRLRLTGVAARLYRYIDTARAMAHLARRFSSLDRRLLDTLLDTWMHLRIAYRDDRDRVLAVLPRKGPHPDRRSPRTCGFTAPSASATMRET